MQSLDYSIIVPCYNEEASVGDVLRELFALPRHLRPAEVIVVDDASTDGTAGVLDGATSRHPELRVFRHEKNLGYGASLKTGIAHAAAEYVAIADADGTYPLSQLSRLAARIDVADMVVGARHGKAAHIPLVRRPAKWVIGRLANMLSGRPIPDLNSGLRMMRMNEVRRFLGILPDGFSFTTTITLAMLTNGLRVEYVPIDYHRRKGRSKIRPIHDTLNFIQLVCRTIMWFSPLRVFIPLSLLLFALAVVVLFGSLWLTGRAWDVTFGILIMTGVFVLAFGMLADLIDKRMR